MWEQKAKNHCKFGVNRETRENKKKEEDDADNKGNVNDDEMVGWGFSIKESDVQKGLNDAKKAAAKSKEN